MRLALQTNTPIVPVAVIGAEESIISIHDWQGLAKLAPYVPISPLLPLWGRLHIFHRRRSFASASGTGCN